MKKFLPSLIASLFYLFGGGVLSAHDAWIEVLGSPSHAIIYGDKVAEPYRNEKIRSVKAYDIHRRQLKTEVDRRTESAQVRVKGEAALLTLFFDNGYWLKVADDYKELKRGEKSPKADTMQTVKLSKTILQWPSWVFEPLGLAMEIVPEKIGPEDRATFRILYHGKPLANAGLENQGYPLPGKTDADGRITIPIKPGLQRLSSEYVDPRLSTSRIGSTSVTAVLVFQVN